MSLRSRSICGAGLALITMMLFSTACSDSSGPEPTLTVAVAATGINLAWGGSDTTTATVTRGGGYAGTAAMTATGAPAGVTVTFTPTTIPASDTSTAVRVDVAASVAPGSYPIVVNAAGSGVTTATATFNVVVVGSFTLGATPVALTVPAGGAAVTSAIAITRTAPFTGPVALTVTGAPAGMTTSFNPASATGATSILSVTADSTVSNSTYSLTILGSGTGVADTTIPVTVAVTGGTINKVVYATFRQRGNRTPAFVSAVNGTANPAVDTIPIHASIRWALGAGTHTVVSTGVPSFVGTNAALTSIGYTVVFNTAGTYTYMCGIHGAAMNGRVVVQ